MEPAIQQEFTYKRESKSKEIWRRFKKSKGAYIGLIMLVLIVAFLVIAPFFVSYDQAIAQDPMKILATPSAEHPLGCDGYGRDILARIIYLYMAGVCH